jgi:hypothetical protein
VSAARVTEPQPLHLADPALFNRLRVRLAEPSPGWAARLASLALRAARVHNAHLDLPGTARWWHDRQGFCSISVLEELQQSH